MDNNSEKLKKEAETLSLSSLRLGEKWFIYDINEIVDKIKGKRMPQA
jgi:hypothetical protein